jgi:hypothetical protein
MNGPLIDRIFRVWGKEDYGADQKFFWTITPFPMGPTLKENFEAVEAQVRIDPVSAQVKVGESSYTESVKITGENFFKVFDFKRIDGDLSAVFHQQGDVVLTRRAAEKFFGNQNVVNKTISIQLNDSFEDFLVKAVIEIFQSYTISKRSLPIGSIFHRRHTFFCRKEQIQSLLKKNSRLFLKQSWENLMKNHIIRWDFNLSRTFT